MVDVQFLIGVALIEAGVFIIGDWIEDLLRP